MRLKNSLISVPKYFFPSGIIGIIVNFTRTNFSFFVLILFEIHKLYYFSFYFIFHSFNNNFKKMNHKTNLESINGNGLILSKEKENNEIKQNLSYTPDKPKNNVPL